MIRRKEGLLRLYASTRRFAPRARHRHAGVNGIAAHTSYASSENLEIGTTRVVTIPKGHSVEKGA